MGGRPVSLAGGRTTPAPRRWPIARIAAVQITLAQVPLVELRVVPVDAALASRDVDGANGRDRARRRNRAVGLPIAVGAQRLP